MIDSKIWRSTKRPNTRQGINISTCFTSLDGTPYVLFTVVNWPSTRHKTRSCVITQMRKPPQSRILCFLRQKIFRKIIITETARGIEVFLKHTYKSSSSLSIQLLKTRKTIAQQYRAAELLLFVKILRNFLPRKYLKLMPYPGGLVHWKLM